MKILPTLQEENSGVRFRTGQGKPGLNILLGGTLQEEDVGDTFGGGGSIGATARLASAYRDTRKAAVAAGRRGGNPIGGTIGGGEFGGYPLNNNRPNRNNNRPNR